MPYAIAREKYHYITEHRKNQSNMATNEFKKWEREMKKEVKRLERQGRLSEAAWLANAHGKQVATIFKGTY